MQTCHELSPPIPASRRGIKVLLARGAAVVATALLAVTLPTGALAAPAVVARPAAQAGSDASRQVEDARGQDQQIRDLVGQLAHAEYGVRERASRELLRLGSSTRPALVAALRHHDAEVRHRARWILAAVLEADFQRRLVAFASDINDGPSDLPAWGRFQELVGSDRASRIVYLEAVRAEPILLEALEQDPGYASQTVTARTTHLYNYFIRFPANRRGAQQQRTHTGSAVALLLAAADPQLRLDDQTATMIFQLMQHSGISQQLNVESQNEPMRRLVGALVRRSADSSLAYHTLWLSMQYDLKEGLVPAETLIRRGERQPYVLQNAILAIGKLGDKQHIKLLEPLLEDKTPVDGRLQNEGFRPEVRDVALAVTIHLSGQQPKDFGFDKIKPNPQTLFQANTMGFDKQQQRDDARKKWNKWLAGRPPEAASNDKTASRE